MTLGIRIEIFFVYYDIHMRNKYYNYESGHFVRAKANKQGTLVFIHILWVIIIARRVNQTSTIH